MISLNLVAGLDLIPEMEALTKYHDMMYILTLLIQEIPYYYYQKIIGPRRMRALPSIVWLFVLEDPPTPTVITGQSGS